MQDRNMITDVGAQYDQKRLFLEPPLLNCKKAQNGSSATQPQALSTGLFSGNIKA
jgi:hypothetical protein